jgi:hypothetical protein
VGEGDLPQFPVGCPCGQLASAAGWLNRSAIACQCPPSRTTDQHLAGDVLMHGYHLCDRSIELFRWPFLIQTCTLTGPSFLLLYSKRSILPRIGSDTFFLVGPHIGRISAGIALDQTPSNDTQTLQSPTDLTLKNSLTTSASLLPPLSPTSTPPPQTSTP